MLFDWIRRQVRDAVLSGFNDAVAEVTGASGGQAPEVPQVRLMLPGPVEGEQAASEEVETGKRVSRRKV